MSHVDRVLGKKQTCGFNLQGPKSYFPNRFQQNILPDIGREAYIKDLSKSLILFLNPAQILELAERVTPDRLEGKQTLLFNSQTILSVFKL